MTSAVQRRLPVDLHRGARHLQLRRQRPQERRVGQVEVVLLEVEGAARVVFDPDCALRHGRRRDVKPNREEWFVQKRG